VESGEYRVESGQLSVVESGEWYGEWRERRECGVRRRRSARSRSPPIGDHTADSIWFFIFADCLISFVCLLVLLQFVYSKP
jgi:hypothetical protein